MTPRSASVVVLLALTGCGVLAGLDDYGPARTGAAGGAGARGGAGVGGEGGDVGSSWLEGAFDRRVRVTVNTSTWPRSPPNDHPIPIQFSSPELTSAVALQTGDVAVTRADGVTLVPFELEQVDPTVVLWVRVPELTPPTNLELIVYFGGGTPIPSPENVWDETWEGVWHLSDAAVDTPIDSAADSSSNGYTLNGLGGPPTSISGIVGRGARFTNEPTERYLERAADKEGLDMGMDSFTVSFWARVESTISLEDTPVWHGAAGNNPGYGFFFGSGTWIAKVADVAMTPATVVFGQAEDLLSGPVSWRFFAMVVDRGAGTMTGHVDGGPPLESQLPAGFGAISPNLNARFQIGRYPNQPFLGDVDEVRVRRAVTTEAALRLDHVAAMTTAMVGVVETRAED